MLDDTQPPLPAMPTREKWRDAIRASECLLSPTARHVAVTMADYIPKGDRAGEDLWCAVSTIVGHTGLSERTVIRATKEIVEKGYMIQTSPKSQYRSPRYRALIPIQTRQDVTSGPDRSARPDVTDCQVNLDVTPDVNLESELNWPTADASGEQKTEAIHLIPEQAPGPTGSTFVDWRPGDFERFAEAIEGTHIASDGTGPWSEGTWDLRNWYVAFRKRKLPDGKGMNWPGIYLGDLGPSLPEYLASLGLEIVDHTSAQVVDDPWATSA